MPATIREDRTNKSFCAWRMETEASKFQSLTMGSAFPQKIWRGFLTTDLRPEKTATVLDSTAAHWPRRKLAETSWPSAKGRDAEPRSHLNCRSSKRENHEYQSPKKPPDPLD